MLINCEDCFLVETMKYCFETQTFLSSMTQNSAAKNESGLENALKTR